MVGHFRLSPDRLTERQVREARAVAPDARWRTFYLLVYTTGARFRELFNLTWNDVDSIPGRIHIRPRKPTPALPDFHVKDKEA